MSPIMPQTLYTFDDEWALGLAERNRVSPLPGGGVRRYQVIWVIRDDRPAAFTADMGPAAGFKANPFQVIASVKTDRGAKLLHRVGELKELADWLRERVNHAHAKRDLMREWRRQREEIKRRRRLQSTFGPKLNLVRS